MVVQPRGWCTNLGLVNSPRLGHRQGKYNILELNNSELEAMENKQDGKQHGKAGNFQVGISTVKFFQLSALATTHDVHAKAGKALENRRSAEAGTSRYVLGRQEREGYMHDGRGTG